MERKTKIDHQAKRRCANYFRLETIMSKKTQAPKRRVYKLSSAQTRLFLLSKFEPGTSVYNINYVKEINGNLDINVIKNSLNLLSERHESLRTVILEIEGKPMQTILTNDNISLVISDLSTIKNREKREKDKIKLVRKIVSKPFSLIDDRLFRANLVKTTKDQHTLVLSMHHIVSDGVSLDILHRDLLAIYNALLRKRKPVLPELRIQYKDYAEWEQSSVNQRRIKKQETYWLEKLQGQLPILNLPTDKPRPVVLKNSGDIEKIEFDKKLFFALKKLANKQNTTVYVLLYTIFSIFINKITGQKDMLIGTPVANRKNSDTQNLVGVFLNNLVIRTEISKNEKFIELLNANKKNIIEAFCNSEYTFENLIEKLNINRDLSRTPIFNVYFQHDSLYTELDKMADLTIKSNVYSNKTAKFDLKFRSWEARKNKLIIFCEYSTDLYFSETIREYLKIFVQIAEEITKAPEKKLADLDYIPVESKNKLIVDFNATEFEYPKSKTIPQIFEEQVILTPAHTAVEFEGKKISYKELNDQADALSQQIVFKNNQNRVGIYLSRSEFSIVAELAILKAGAVCVPLDVTYPKQRLGYIAKDANINLVISEKILKNDCQDIIESQNIICIDKPFPAKKMAKSLNACKATDLAYLMYTSGSTGDPKGVKLVHRGIVNQAWHRGRQINVCDKDVFAHTVSTGFVSSIIHWYVPLFLGAKVVIYGEDEIVDPYNLFVAIDRDAVTFVEVIASTLRGFLAVIEELDKPNLNNLRYLLISGEQTIASTVNNFFNNYQHIKLINGCGQCECSALTLHYIFPEARTDYVQAPIGRPISNTQIYILNDNLQPVARGTEGELCISGDGLASGYLNKPNKTKQAFVDNPFIDGKKLYRTGDIVKMLPDNNLLYIRRADHQVQIRGYRVELGEVEFRLANIEGIKECRVMSKIDKIGDTFLVAYYTGIKWTSSKIREELSREMPSYMIPNFFVHLKKFPKNANGKIDVPNLPDPHAPTKKKDKYDKPHSIYEKKLIQLWKEVLNVKSVNLNDNFFNLGGHSLKAVVLVSKINQSFGAELQMKDVFISPTVSELSRVIREYVVVSELNEITKKQLEKD